MEGIDQIHVDGVGLFPAKTAEQFKKGDVMVWRYGFKSRVLEIYRETPQTITFTVEACQSKEQAKRLFFKKKLIAYTDDCEDIDSEIQLAQD